MLKNPVLCSPWIDKASDFFGGGRGGGGGDCSPTTLLERIARVIVHSPEFFLHEGLYIHQATRSWGVEVTQEQFSQKRESQRNRIRFVKKRGNIGKYRKYIYSRDQDKLNRHLCILYSCNVKRWTIFIGKYI